MPMKLARLGLLVGAPSVAGYYSGRYIGGAGFQTRTEADMVAALATAAPTAPLSTHSTTDLPDLASIVKTTEPQTQPDGTVVSHAYCGQKSVGFPFMVHGGLLASLLKQQTPADQGQLTVRYRRPTHIDQVLRFETRPTPNGSQTLVFAEHGKHPLIEAEMVKDSWRRWLRWW